MVQVQRNMQGHPEAPRLWAKHIHGILKHIGPTPERHEPCLYRGEYDGKEAFLIRQVDNFCVSAADVTTATTVLCMIDDNLTEPLKYQGIIDYFNGVTIKQSNAFVQIICEAYLKRVFK